MLLPLSSIFPVADHGEKKKRVEERREERKSAAQVNKLFFVFSTRTFPSKVDSDPAKPI